jgi:hypothetical protein
VALLALEMASGTDGPLFYATALTVISVNRFFLAALSASLPHVVTRETLVTANALTTTSGTVVAILGGGIALTLREVVGTGNGGYALIALVSAFGYAASAFAAGGFPADLLGPDDVEREHRETLRDVARGLVAGARHVIALRPVAYSLAAISAHRFFYGISTISVLLLYRNYFVTDGIFLGGLSGLGQVFAASGFGVLLAASITPAVVRRIGKQSWIAFVFAAAAVTEIALGLPFTMQTIIPAALLLSVVAQGSKISVDTLVQEMVEDEFRGRVFSFYDTLFNITFVAAAVVAAFVLPPDGRSHLVVALIAAGYAVTAVSYRLVSRRSA